MVVSESLFAFSFWQLFSSSLLRRRLRLIAVATATMAAETAVTIETIAAVICSSLFLIRLYQGMYTIRLFLNLYRRDPIHFHENIPSRVPIYLHGLSL